MKRAPLSAWSSLLPLPFVIAGSGCASLRAYDPPPEPPTAHVRASIGAIGIDYDPQVATPDLQRPQSKGAGAATGAGEGSLLALDAAAHAGEGCIFVLATMPVWMIAGSISGAVRGVPKKEQAIAEAALTNAVAQLAFADLLHEHCIQQAQQYITNKVVSWRSQSRAPSHPSDNALPSSLSPTGGEGADTNRVDTLLQLKLLNLSLAGRPGINPPVALAIMVQPTLIRAENNQEIYSYFSAYFDGAILTASDPKSLQKLLSWHTRFKDGPPWAPRPNVAAIQHVESANSKKFTAWSAQDACEFRAEVHTATQALARSIVEHLFIRQPSTENNASEQTKPPH